MTGDPRGAPAAAQWAAYVRRMRTGSRVRDGDRRGRRDRSGNGMAREGAASCNVTSVCAY
ncbi:hypothetical protein BSIN_3388 [Burkholderia singularis]|uniref:Uncharacterized protein n=1 Tax=Burkholderia singularis TaxID=1503053 RepID=A0A238H4Z8_9BURK|nr:hypothetical protein BSIN_3388 [Burkholderia singularis]